MSKRKLRLAISQFSVTGDVCANSRWIQRHMKRAAKNGADVAHFSEASLSGYGGAEVVFDEHYDWVALKKETDRIRALARELKLWVVLGSAHPRKGGKPYNSLYLISPQGRTVKRYDKCFCTGGDLKQYESGRNFPTHTINGVKCGFLICYDFRFPEMYRAYLKKGVRLMFHSFHQVSAKPEKLMRQVAPAHITSRAAENFMFVSANNCGRPYQWFASRLHAPDGSTIKMCRQDGADLILTDVDLAAASKLYNAPRENAMRAVKGLLYSVPGEKKGCS